MMAVTSRMLRNGLAPVFMFLGLLVLASHASAQVALTKETLNRWMETAVELNDMSDIFETLGEDIEDEEDEQRFYQMSPDEMNRVVQREMPGELANKVNAITGKHKWKHTGEFVWYSNRIGNAIAAYFHAETLSQVPAEHAALMNDYIDPAIKNVPAADIQFIRENWQDLANFMGQYMRSEFE